MNRTMINRVARIEDYRKAERSSYIVVADLDPEDDDAMQDFIDNLPFGSPVVIVPRVLSDEEWKARYCR